MSGSSSSSSTSNGATSKRGTSTADAEAQESSAPGSQADQPQDIPAAGWRQIVKRGLAEAKADQVPLLAAGVAFYAFLAIFPALIAAVLLYGFFADPAQITAQVESALSGFPPDAKSLITAQLTTVSSSGGGAGFGAVVSILLALWSASGGVSNLMGAVNTAYDEDETRSFVKKRLTALALTAGTIVVVLVMLGLVAVLPAVLSVFGTGGLVQVLIQVGRWVLLAAVISVALAVLYRVAPDRDAPKMRWVSVGAVAATVLWLLASVGFSVYVSNFGNNSYAKTYGALAGIVIFLFWLWISAYAILLGAEINAEAEQQTAADTTKGPAQPAGQRGAVKADSPPPAGGPDDGSRPNSTTSPGEDAASPHDPDPDHSHRADSGRAVASRAEGRTQMTEPTKQPSELSTGELFTAVTQDLSRLVRDEIRLAQAEVSTKAKAAGVGIGAFGGAGVLALYGLGVLLAAAVLGLANVVSPWLAALVVGVVLFVVAGVAALVGKRKLSQGAPPVPTQAIESVKTDVAEIKESIQR